MRNASHMESDLQRPAPLDRCSHIRARAYMDMDMDMDMHMDMDMDMEAQAAVDAHAWLSLMRHEPCRRGC